MDKQIGQSVNSATRKSNWPYSAARSRMLSELAPVMTTLSLFFPWCYIN